MGGSGRSGRGLTTTTSAPEIHETVFTYEYVLKTGVTQRKKWTPPRKLFFIFKNKIKIFLKFENEECVSSSYQYVLVRIRRFRRKLSFLDFYSIRIGGI